ncbi:MAG: diguanylate cyclase [Burkholderiaceae bacterium]
MRPATPAVSAHALGRGVVVLLVALVAMAVVASILTARARSTLTELRRADQINVVLPLLTKLQEDVLNAETGQRGYLLTQKPRYLQPYRDAIRVLDRRMEELIRVDADPAHAARLLRVREVLELKRQELAQTIRLNDAGRHDEALELVLSDQGQRHMEALRDLMGELIAEMHAERTAIGAQLSRDAGRTELLLMSALAILVLFSVLAVTQVMLGTRQTERAERRLRGIADNVPAMISHFDRSGRLRFANAEVGRIFRTDIGALIGKTFEEMRGRADSEPFAPYIERVLGGQPVEFDAPLEIDGETRHFHQRFVPDMVNGEVAGFYAVSLDITDRKRIDGLVADSERRMKAVTDNLPVLITYVDARQRLRFANETLRDWLGVDPGSVIGMPLSELMGPSLYQQRSAQLALGLQGERVEFEVTSMMRGGRLRHMKNIYVPDVAADGSVLGIYTLGMDITVEKQAERQLAQLASSDALTGLPNRREFDQSLIQALSRQRRHARDGRAMALLFLDVDRFKLINDTHGHGVGDLVLREFALCLRRTVRASDLVARIAGDEFVAILEGLNHPDEAALVAHKILDAVRALSPAQVPLSASIGVATLLDADAPPLDLIALADRALYQAKREGRDRCAVLHWPVLEQRR